MRATLLLSCLLPWLACLPAGADELRLKDGEILVGTVIKEEKGRLFVRGESGVRRVRVADVQERLAPPAPEDDTPGEVPRSALEAALAAWHARRDGLARMRAEKVLADPARSEAEQATARALRGPGLGALRWGQPKRAAQGRLGGTAATDKRVRAALDWLAAHQDEDGKLDADGFQRHDPADDPCDGQGGGHHGERVACPYDGVTTAVALMAWLAGGSTPVSGPHREAVGRALAYCRARLRAGPGSAYGLWNHGFCTQALADAYAVSRDPTLRADLKEAVAAILRLQRSDGGWSYYLPIGDVPTTAVAGTALALSARAGVPVPEGALERMLAFLDARVDAGSGRSEYHLGAEHKGYTPTRANTAAALAVRALLGRLDGAPDRERQFSALRGRSPVWKLSFKDVKTADGRTVRAQIGTLYPYLWYYTTLALHGEGGRAWTSWFSALKKALAKGQRGEGSAAGSWDPLGTYSSSAGRVFITALCALMLQAPYRYPR